MHTHTATRAQARLQRPAAAALSAAILGLAFAVFFAPLTPAQAHDQLIDAVIETNADGEAQALRLSFSDTVLEIGTEIHVTAPDGGDATNGLPSFSGRDVTQQFQTPLVDGNYTSAWRVVSSDGHPIEGGFTFDVASGAAGEVRPYTGEEAADAVDTDADAADATTADDNAGQGLVLPLSIAAGALVAVAVAIPMFIRMRKRAASAEGEDPRASEE